MKADVLASTQAATRDANLQQRRTALLHQIRHLREVQAIYMNDIEDTLARNPQSPGTEPEDMNLWLPSALSPAERLSTCVNNIAGIEDQLREAQCRDSLAKMRNYLHTQAHFIKYRNTNIRGQRANTRAKTLMDTLTAKIGRTALKYRAARAAVLQLRGPGPWQQELQELQSKDVCGPTATTQENIGEADGAVGPNGRPRAKKQRLGEGFRTTSWIWASGTVTAGDNQVTDGTLIMPTHSASTDALVCSAAH